MQGTNEEETPHTGRSRRKGAAHLNKILNDNGHPRKTHTARYIRIRRLIIFAILEVIVLFGIHSYANVLKQYNKIQRNTFEVKNVENKDLSEDAILKMKGYWNIAVFGVDSRNSSLGRGNNSDVIMVVSINRETGDVKIVSVYRDTYLSTGNGSYNKINSAYAVGGPEQAVRALNQNLDLNITDYVTFNWKAVATGINILGGVDIEITKAEFRYINSYITETVKGTGIGSTQLAHAGMNHLDGVQAVAYARLRYMDDDYTRTERQRKVISLCVDKAKKADAQTLSDLAGNILSMTATSLTWEDGMSLATHVAQYQIADTTGFPEDRAEVNMGPKGACVVPKTLESNVKNLHTFLFGDENYEVSSKVQEIDDKIWSDVDRYRNYSSSSSGSGKKSSTSSTETKKSETETETTSEKETDENGQIILGTDESGNVIYETDADGNPVTAAETETDEDGNVIYNNGEPAEPETDENGNLIFPSGVPGETVSGGTGGPGSSTVSSDEETASGDSSESTSSESLSGPDDSDSGYVDSGPGATKAATEASETDTSSASGIVTPGSVTSQTTETTAVSTTAASTTTSSTTAATTAASTTAVTSPIPEAAGPGSSSSETVENVPQ